MSETAHILDTLYAMYELKITALDGKFLWGYVNHSNYAFALSDYSLCNGFAGMALFASALAYVSNDVHVKDRADYFVHEAINEINITDNIAPIGEAGGLDGVLKAFALIKRYGFDERPDDICSEILCV